MALTERTRAYETLIRHQPGGGIGAHHVTITEVLRDGAVINATVNPPQPVAGAALEAILGDDLVVALARIETLQAEAMALRTQVAELQQALAQALAVASSVASDGAQEQGQLQVQEQQAEPAA